MLGALTQQWAAIASGAAADGERLSRHLAALDTVAGLEAWWWTAQLARAADDDRLRDQARRRVATLVARAGERGDALTAAAARLLDPYP